MRKIMGLMKIIITIMTVVVLIGCGGEKSKTEEIKLNKITIIADNNEIDAGESLNLRATAEPIDSKYEKIVWSVDNETVAEINQEGVLITKTNGNIKVTAKSGNISDSINIVINKPITEKNNMIMVEGGSFEMFSPKVKINLDSFYIAKYETTVSEFKSFIESDKYITEVEKTEKGWVYIEKNGRWTWDNKTDANWRKPYYIQNDNYPVVLVNWYDCIAFCNWLSRKNGYPVAYKDDVEITHKDYGMLINEKGEIAKDTTETKGFRLPTDAEWEYAARGGKLSKGYKFSGSDIVEEVAVYNNLGEGTRRPEEVGKKKPNELGIYDMSGNVWEWCSDTSVKFITTEKTNPIELDGTTYRVARGGGWFDKNSEIIAIKNRMRLTSKDSIDSGLSFRICRTAK